MDTIILAARVGLSLAAVLALLWWIARRTQGSTMLKRRRRESVVLLGRQQLGAKTGVALVETAGRRLVLGYGEHGVTLLHDAGDIELEEEQPLPAKADLDRELIELTEATASPSIATVSARKTDAQRPRSPLEGSILAPQTWRKAVVAAQEWTTRRS